MTQNDRARKLPSCTSHSGRPDPCLVRHEMVESFCREPHDRFRLGNSSSLLYWDDRTKIQPDSSADLLACCSAYKTLEEHARALIRGCANDSTREGSPDCVLALGATKTDEMLSKVLSRLESLVEAGLLTPHSDILRQCLLTTDKPPEQTSISSLGIVTSDRPGALRRCVSSYAGNLRDYGRDTEIVVVDDSRDPAVRRRNRETLHEVHACYGVRLAYGGLEEKEAYCAELVAGAEVPPQVVRFALFPPAGKSGTYGANRNALLLATAGQLTVSVDDDTVCTLVPHPQIRERLSVADPNEFGDVHFFPGKEQAIGFASCSAEDFLALHEQLLGKSLGQCARRFGYQRTDISTLSARLVRSLRDGGGEVLLTSLGVLGDSGLRTPHWFLFFGAPTRERLIGSEATYRLAMRSRQVFRAVMCPTITDAGGWLGFCMGMDNRKPLPPFMPLCRGEDGVFMSTLMLCHTQAWVGHLPFAALHDPPDVRRYELEDISVGVARVLAADLVEAVMHSASLAHNTNQISLKALGGSLMEIGSLSMQEYHRYVRQACWRSFHLCVTQLQQQLKAGHDAPLWTKDVQEQIERVWNMVTCGTFPTSKDVLAGSTEDERRAADRQFIYDLGALYYHWSDIKEAARELHRKGRRLPEYVR